jgi:hypothetical protein
MPRKLLLALVSVSILASPALAAEDAAAPTADVSARTSVAAPTDAEVEAARSERLQRIELAARMDAVIEASNKTLAGLQKLIDATTDPATGRDLERRMAEVKRGTQIDLLRVQATFARENGRIAQAEQIDAEIEAILNPKRPARPAGAAPARTSVAPAAGGAR